MWQLYSRKKDATRCPASPPGSGRSRRRSAGPRLQRARRIAVGNRDAAVDLGHDDDLDRVGVDGDQVVLAHERGGLDQGLLGQGDDGVVGRHLGGDLVQHGPHLVGTGAAATHPCGGLGDLLADPLQLRLGPGQQGVRVVVGVQGHGAAGGSQLRPFSRGVTGCASGQALGQPGQVLVEGRDSGVGAGPDLLTPPPPPPEFGGDQVRVPVNWPIAVSTWTAGIPPGSRVQVRAGLHQRGGNRRQPARGRAHPVGGRGELAGRRAGTSPCRDWPRAVSRRARAAR